MSSATLTAPAHDAVEDESPVSGLLREACQRLAIEIDPDKVDGLMARIELMIAYTNGQLTKGADKIRNGQGVIVRIRSVNYGNVVAEVVVEWFRELGYYAKWLVDVNKLNAHQRENNSFTYLTFSRR